MPDIDPTTLALRLAIARKSSPFGVVAWSPDGRRIAAAGSDGVIWVWTVGDSEPLLLNGHMGEVITLAWSPDAATVASGSLPLIGQS
jgi:WD40 repeat protein